MNKKKEETLADKIAGVLNATPADFDPEDDDLDNTRAQVVDADLFEEDDAEEELLSTFRKQNVDLFADYDERYKGEKATRKDFYSSDEDVLSSDKEKLADLESENETDEGENDSDKVESEGSVSDSEDDRLEDSSGNEEDSGNNVGNEDGIKTMTETDMSVQVKRGLCVRNQLQIWENLLEMRIQLQKCLITANKMPQDKTFKEIKKSSGKEFSDPLSITKNSVAKLLDKLLLLQTLVQKKYPETKNLGKEKAESEDEDEEIPSDTDGEETANDEEEDNVAPRKKRKLSEFGEEISDSHAKYKDYRNSVIQKWNEKTRIATMKNNPNAPSVLNHIEHILRDKEKLIKRTQLKRSAYTILGEERVENDQQGEDNQTKSLEEYNTEIFDDDDFYHQLLRELIEVKSADLTDPVQLSRQWIQLQNMRSKMKRKVDTRATKGRKIRYAVHTKLVNFMAPIDNHQWTEEGKDELFNSLFGKFNRVVYT